MTVNGNDPAAPDSKWDVVVIGGGVTGLSGALTLARVGRSVVVIDAGEARDLPAFSVHGLLGRDGAAPADLLRDGRDEVTSYGGRILCGRVERIRRDGGHFEVTVEGGDRLVARRMLVAGGLVDDLPDIPGLLAQRWGADIVHCVYCNGWEARDTAVGVLSNFHQAVMFRQLTSDVTLFLPPGRTLPDEHWNELAAKGITVIMDKIAEIENAGGRLTGVRLAGGTVVRLRRLVVAAHVVAQAAFLDGLGLTAIEHPDGAGLQIAVDHSGFTGVTGVWAVGDVGHLRAGVPAAAGEAAVAAAAINVDLLVADARDAVRRRLTGNAGVFTAEMEAEVSRRVLGVRRHGLEPSQVSMGTTRRVTRLPFQGDDRPASAS